MSDDREKNLPNWAQSLINDLRLRVQIATEQSAKEIARLRPRVDLLERRNESLNELLECAAKGGHITSSEIIEVLAGNSLVLAPNEK